MKIYAAGEEWETRPLSPEQMKFLKVIFGNNHRSVVNGSTNIVTRYLKMNLSPESYERMLIRMVQPGSGTVFTDIMSGLITMSAVHSGR